MSYVSGASDQHAKTVIEATTQQPNRECAVCLDDYTKVRHIQLTCRHTYCTDCILEWISVHNNRACPACRAIVALSQEEIDAFSDLGLQFPPKILGTVHPLFAKFIISAPQNIQPHTLTTFLEFFQQILDEIEDSSQANHRIFRKDLLLPYLQLANICKLRGMALDAFTTSFSRSLSMLSHSDIQSFLLQKTDREGLIKLLEPVFGVCPVSDSHAKAFVYSKQSIKIYAVLGLIDIASIKSLVIEYCTVNEQTLGDIAMLLEAPHLEDLTFAHVGFDLTIAGLSLPSLKSLTLNNIFGDDEEENCAKNTLQQLLAASSQLVSFSFVQTIWIHPKNLLPSLLRHIGHLKCKLVFLKVLDHHQNYYRGADYPSLLTAIFRNSKSTLKEVFLANHDLSSLKDLDDFSDSLSQIVTLDSLHVSKISFPTSQMHLKFIASLVKLPSLNYLGLDLTECDNYDNEPKSLHSLPGIFKGLTNLRHLSLAIIPPSSTEALSSIRRLLESATSLVRLDITLESCSESTPNLTADIFEVLRAQHALKNLTFRYLYAMPECDAKIIFREVSSIQLDSMSLYCKGSRIHLYSTLKSELRPDAKIGTLKILGWFNNSLLLDKEMGEKLAKMSELTELDVSTWLHEPSNSGYLEFFDALSESSSLTKLRILYTRNYQWNDDMCSILKKFKNLKVIEFDTTRSEKEFISIKKSILSNLGDLHIEISHSSSVEDH